MKPLTFRLGIIALIFLAMLPVRAQNNDDYGAIGNRDGQRPADRPHNRENVVETRNGGSNRLRGRLHTDRTQYAPGRGVEITLSLANESDVRYVISVNNSHEYDIIVRSNRTNREVWRWSQNRRPTTYKFAVNANETRINREFWDQRDGQGKRVPSGAYTIEARITPKESLTLPIYLMDGNRTDDNSDRFDERGNGNNNSDDSGQIGSPILRGDDNFGNPQSDSRFGPMPTGLRGELNYTMSRSDRPPHYLFTYTVKNGSDRQQTARFGSARQFEIEVRHTDRRSSSIARLGGDDTIVWSSSRGNFYTDALTTIRLQSGDTKPFTAVWKPTSDLPTGSYEAIAYLPVMGDRSHRIAQATTHFQVGSIAGGDISDDLRDLLTHTDDYIGRSVTVSGIYHGRHGSDLPPPVRRSDWVVEAKGRTIYVTGGLPRAEEGKSISVTGIVRRTVSGQPYIETPR